MSFCKLTTVWGENIGDTPLQEYPRPQFRRDSYFNLNGWWQYAVTKSGNEPPHYDGKILVPFSPECALSDVNRQLSPKEFLWYTRTFELPKNFNKGVVLLHFGAVDSTCRVFVNNHYVCRHVGGYNAFSTNITPYLKEGENKLTVRVRDFSDTSYFTHGKQCLRRKGIWYTPQSGIWQTVWMESVPQQYINAIKITPNIDSATVTVDINCNFDEPVTAIIYDGEKEVAKADGKHQLVLHFPEGKFEMWSPENPFLYNLTVISRRDMVKSYFGMRKFSVEKVDGKMRIMLNNKPYFQSGVLDQGYWPDGLYTAPSDEAMIFDIQTMKNMGFNMLRKHIKVEPMRWYYHCDRLGMLVWQDMPSGGTRQHKLITQVLPVLGKQNIRDKHHFFFSRFSAQSREQYMTEYDEMLAQLYNCTCICTWVPFNEGWGQFDALRIAKRTKMADPTRLVDHASGWHDQGGGDLKSLHVYFSRVKFKNDDYRATVLSEFGGGSYKELSHSFNLKNTYSYNKYENKEEFNSAFKQLYEREVIANIPKGLCAAVYTQLSDVEDEVNGLLTYDRMIQKVDDGIVKYVNERAKI